MIYKFPQGFLFGSSTVSPQIFNFDKGPGKVDDIWSYWYKKEKNQFFKEQPVLNQGYSRFKEDIQLAHWLGFTTLNISISWSRLFPDGKTICQETIDFYNELINEMIAKGIEPMIHLFHFDMPMWAQELGGWESRDVVISFAKYAKKCFQLFSDRVKTWFTFNEPTVVCTSGYLFGNHYPCIQNFQKCYQVQYHLVLAHSLAVIEFRKLKIKNEEIGIVLNLLHPIPRSNDEKDLKAAKDADELLHSCFLNPTIKGKYSSYFDELLKKNNVLIRKKEGDEKIIKKGIIDVIGVNYYNPTRVKAPKRKIKKEGLTFENFFEPYRLPNAKMNVSRGWEIYPKAIYDVLMNLKKNYNNLKSYITENGMGVAGEEKLINKDGIVQDDYRIEFISEHMAWVARAISEGANCHGYSMWTYIDNWSWTNAYKNRYGYFRLNLETGVRTPKKSAFWIKEVIKKRELEV